MVSGGRRGPKGAGVAPRGGQPAPPAAHPADAPPHNAAARRPRPRKRRPALAPAPSGRLPANFRRAEGARRLTTFCAYGRPVAAACGWRPRPPAGRGGAGGGPGPRAPRSPGPPSSSCCPPSRRGRPRRVRRRRRGSAGPRLLGGVSGSRVPGAAAPRRVWVTCPRRRGAATGPASGHVAAAPGLGLPEAARAPACGRGAGGRGGGRCAVRGAEKPAARCPSAAGCRAVRDVWRPVLGVFQRERAPPVCHCPRSSGSRVLVVSVNTGKTGILKFDFLWPFVCSFVSGESRYLSVSLSKCI